MTRRRWSALGACAMLAALHPDSRPPRGADRLPVVFIAASVRDSMNAIWTRNNKHWDELGRVNTLTQMLGTGPPTQHEYMGCLVGRAGSDTVWVTSWAPARDLKQLQFAVTGTCDHVEQLIGTWHTHPYRAAPDGTALKEPALSAGDLKTFQASRDRVILAAWDVDSIDAAVRTTDGAVWHARVAGYTGQTAEQAR
jgi:hypothetical protein